MGQSAKCTASFADQESAGMALLESDQLIFRGDFRLAIRLKEISAVTADNGRLRVSFPAGTATFDIGRVAEAWCLKIRHPKGLLDKLGVKPESRIVVLGIEDEFLTQLAARATDLSIGRKKKGADLIFLLADEMTALQKLASLSESLQRNGALWVVAPKGKKHIREADVLAAAKNAGLVDVKVVSFSETHTAHKLVIPVARR